MCRGEKKNTEEKNKIIIINGKEYAAIPVLWKCTVVFRLSRSGSDSSSSNSSPTYVPH